MPKTLAAFALLLFKTAAIAAAMPTTIADQPASPMHIGSCAVSLRSRAVPGGNHRYVVKVVMSAKNRLTQQVQYATFVSFGMNDDGIPVRTVTMTYGDRFNYGDGSDRQSPVIKPLSTLGPSILYSEIATTTTIGSADDVDYAAVKNFECRVTAAGPQHEAPWIDPKYGPTARR